MKLNIRCPKCKASDVEVIAEKGNPIPMYRCKNCGYKHTLFAQIKDKKE